MYQIWVQRKIQDPELDSLVFDCHQDEGTLHAEQV